MPNDCWNFITLTGPAEQVDAFVANELAKIPEHALTIRKRGHEGIYCKLWSPWHPDFEWLESLLSKYADVWVKNVWDEEGGFAGVWVGTNRGGEPKIQRLEWEDMCLEEESYRFQGLSG